MNKLNIPNDVVERLPIGSLVRRLIDNDATLGRDLSAVARAKAFGKVESIRKELATKKL